jgi:hypothetical protein
MIGRQYVSRVKHYEDLRSKATSKRQRESVIRGAEEHRDPYGVRKIIHADMDAYSDGSAEEVVLQQATLPRSDRLLRKANRA